MILAVAIAAALVLAACGEKEGKKAEEPKAEEPTAKENSGTPTAKEGPVTEKPAAGEDKPEKTATATATETAPETATEAAKATETATYDLVKPVEEASRYLPDGLLAIAVLDLSAIDHLASAILPTGALFTLPEEKQKALEEELVAYHKKKLGFAVRKLDSVVLFASATGDVGILVKGVIEEAEAGAPKTEEVEGHRLIQLGQPRDLSIFSIKDFGVGLYVPKAVSLADYLRTAVERKEGLDRFAAFKKDLGSRTDSWYMTVIDFTNPIFTMIWPADAPVARPNRGIIAFKNTGLVVEIEAGKKCLDDIDKWVKLGREQGKMLITQAKAKLDSLEVAQGTAVIFADALFDEAFNSLAPKRSEGRMTLDLDLQVWGALPVIGILSSVAIPAFIKYMRKAKTSEAIDQLDKIVKGAVHYYSMPRVDTMGNRVPAQFPPSVAATPAPGTCCGALGGADTDGNDKCDVNIAAWSNETWNALNFHMSDQHYFTYEFKNNGLTGADAQFEAIAYGDLDCDGVKSTFARTGKGSEPYPGEFSVELGYLFTENETE